MTDLTADPRLFDANGKALFKDPVFLSGGSPLAEIVEGTGWPVNKEKILDGFVYRRIARDGSPGTADQAVFCGKAK
jgi:hypothetical protein